MILTNIRQLCSDNGITVTQLEKELELGKGSIGKWNKSHPTVGKLIKVAEYFNVTVDYLLGVNPVVSDEALEIAKQFDMLNEKQKDLIKCYISII